MTREFDNKAMFLKLNFSVIAIFVSLTLVFDFFDKIEIFYLVDFLKFNRFLKAAVLFYALFFMVVQFKYVISRLKYLLFTIIVISIIFILKYGFWSQYIDEFARYGFFLFFLPIIHFAFTFSRSQQLPQMLYRLFQVFILLNTMAVLVGFIFDIEAFSTYQYGRFGYNGFLLSQGLTPYVYMCASAMFWVKRDYKMLLLVVGLSIISGVKGVYLGQFALLVFFVFWSNQFNKKTKAKILMLGGLVSIGALIFVFSTPTFREVINNDGVWSAIFSYRLDNLYELIQDAEPKSYNVFIGVLGIETTRIEMQLIDVLLFFGITGAVVYTYFLFHFYNDIITKPTTKALFAAMILLSLFSGNLLYIPLASVLMALSIVCLELVDDRAHESELD